MTLTLDRPKPAAATTLYLRAAPPVAPEEELYLLAALEAAALQEPSLKFRYGTAHPEIMALLTRRWFLDEVRLLADAADWERWPGGATALTLPEPDPELAGQAEQDLYDAAHAAETSKIQRQQAAVNEAGVKDLVLPLPEHRFHPGWHKTNGYLWSLGDYLGVPVQVPPTALTPYGDQPKERTRAYLKQFQQGGLSRRPFLLYDLQAEENPFALLGALGASFGEIQWVSVAEVADLLAVAPPAVPVGALLALCGHPNARFCLGPVGKVLTCAWAAGLPNLLELYAGANPAWDGVQGPNALRVPRDQYPGEELARALTSAAQLLVHRAR